MGRAPTRPCSHAPACTFRGTLGLLTQHLCVALGAFVEETWRGSGCRLATLPLRKSALLHSALQAYPSKKVGNVGPHYLGIGNGIGPWAPFLRGPASPTHGRSTQPVFFSKTRAPRKIGPLPIEKSLFCTGTKKYGEPRSARFFFAFWLAFALVTRKSSAVFSHRLTRTSTLNEPPLSSAQDTGTTHYRTRENERVTDRIRAAAC